MNIHAEIQLLIKKVIEHKTRNGFIAFILGLIMVVGALYIDVLRGDTSGTIGLYQIIGSLIGYMFTVIGAILAVKETRLRKTLQNIFMYTGGIIVAISVLAKYIGISGEPGFDKFQTAGTIVGMLIAGIGFYIKPNKNAAKKITDEK